MFRNLIDKFLFRGYETAKVDATLRIIARYSRGNTAIQNGYLIDEDGLARLRVEGDRAARRLAKIAPVDKRSQLQSA